MIKPEQTVMAPEVIRSAHFVGIGGSGMSGIARMFLARGITVTGSDRSDSANAEHLRELGARVAVGHDAANLGEVDVVVVTGALWLDNPEYQKALERGIPVLHRSRALEWLARGHRLISVAGAHGKTTSTGMIVTAMLELGVSPSFVNGGVVQSLGESAAPGTDDIFVIEADESDGSFLLYDTAVALITNVDADHLDHYGDHDAFDRAFVEFASNAAELVVISSDDPGALRVRKGITGPKLLSFGEAPGSDVQIVSIDTSAGNVRCTVTWQGQVYDIALQVPGRHNAINAAGAFAVLVGMGYDPAAVASALAAFGGTVRRFELHGVRRGVSVFDDYAHHPTEVDAVLSAARTVVGSGRIIAVHQPHTYSRTQLMSGEFAEVLEQKADLTVVLDVYGAREDPVPGVTGALVSERFTDPKKVHFVADWQQAADQVAVLAQEGDYVITLGCGDVYRIIPQILGSLEASDQGGR